MRKTTPPRLTTLAVCQCDAGGSVNVQGPTFGATFGRGAQVDLEAAVAPGHALTWRQALGGYLNLFTPIDEAPITLPAQAEAGLPEGSETAIVSADVDLSKATVRPVSQRKGGE